MLLLFGAANRDPRRYTVPDTYDIRPEDIAAACAFSVSEEAGYITGQILGVNGGRNT